MTKADLAFMASILVSLYFEVRTFKMLPTQVE